jgi:hypothetical protein
MGVIRLAAEAAASGGGAGPGRTGSPWVAGARRRGRLLARVAVVMPVGAAALAAPAG